MHVDIPRRLLRGELHAESLLSQTGVGEVLEPGRTEGSFENGRYRWTMDIQPWVDPSLVDVPQQPVDPGAPRLLSLDLQVQWGSGAERERLHLQSLRLVTPNPLGDVR